MNLNHKPWAFQHLHSTTDIPTPIFDVLVHAARKLKKISSTPGQYPTLLKGRTIATLFFENSTRTRLSFEQAAQRLGGWVSSFTAQTSSLSKGESLLDTTLTVNALGADCLVIRHSESGVTYTLAKSLSTSLATPLVNAGDGSHEHPTQALSDAFTLLEKWETLKGKKILILGDILHSRVAHSNIELLSRLGAKIFVSGPPTLLPSTQQENRAEIVINPDKVIGEMNAVMCLRIQQERQTGANLPSFSEYFHYWGLTQERFQKLQKNTLILDPGPVLREVHICSEAVESSQSCILEQVRNGVFMRMAILSLMCNPTGFEQWMQDRL